MSNILFVLIILSALGAGINAGLFFIFSNTVMNSLEKLPSSSGISAMQNINRIIQNPIFFAVFMGTALLSALLAISMIWFWGPGSIYILLGALVYIFGCFLVTVVKNVPMNNALDVVKADSAEAAELWGRYLIDWTAWNHVRTVACILSTLSFILGFKYW